MAAVAALAVAVVLRSAGAAEELKLTNGEAVFGSWRIAEVELYADDACTVRLPVDTSSAFASPLPTGKVWRHDIQNQGRDCFGQCHGGGAGFCDWCGLGNACCRAGSQSDPPECQYAVGFTGEQRHECVAVGPHGPLTQESVQDAFDGSLSTSFAAACPERRGCEPGTVAIGASLTEEAASVRCIAVVLPSADLPAAGPAERGKQLRLWRRSPLRVSPGCPGVCQSGRYLESGPCLGYLGQHGWCGTGPSYSGGTDCRGCRGERGQPWEALNLQIVRLESRAGGELRAVRMTAVAEAPAAGAVAVGEPRRREEVPPLPRAGQDCWGRCAGSNSGYCASFCGLGNACCRKGYDADPSECRTAYGFTGVPQHECVRTVLLHAGEDCWGACGGRSGHCDWCGRGNACCNRGFEDAPEECRAAVFASPSYHHCVRLSYQPRPVLGSLRGRSAQAPGELTSSGLQVPRPRDGENATALQPRGVSVSVSVLNERASIEEDVLVLRLWISVCLLSAALGAALGVACLLLHSRPCHRQAPAGEGACLLLQQRRLALSRGDAHLQPLGVGEDAFGRKKAKAIEWVE